MQTSPLIAHLIDLNAEPGPAPDAGVLSPFGATHSASKLAAAEAQGYERGRRGVEGEMRQRIADLEAQFAQEREKSRRQWTEAQGQKLQAQLTDGLARIRLEIAQSIAGVITPFIAGRLREQAVDELTAAAEAIVKDGLPLTVEVSGPPDLTNAIAKQLESHATVVKIALVETPELRVKIDNRMIETRFGDWISIVEDVLR